MINLAEQALCRAVCMFRAEVREKGRAVGLLSHSLAHLALLGSHRKLPRGPAGHDSDHLVLPGILQWLRGLQPPSLARPATPGRLYVTTPFLPTFLKPLNERLLLHTLVVGARLVLAALGA